VSRRRTVEDWRRVVLRSQSISNPVRVLLLYLADRMFADRKVSVPRTTIAQDLGVSERRVTARVSAARNAGFLDTVVRGQKHVTAVYQGLFPVDLRGTSTSPLRGAHGGPPEKALRGTHGGPTITTADPSVGGTEGDDATHADSTPSVRVTAHAGSETRSDEEGMRGARSASTTGEAVAPGAAAQATGPPTDVGAAQSGPLSGQQPPPLAALTPAAGDEPSNGRARFLPAPTCSDCGHAVDSDEHACACEGDCADAV